VRISTVLSVLFFASGVVGGAWAQEFQGSSTTEAGSASKADSGFTFSERLDGGYNYPLDAKGGELAFKAHVQLSRPEGFSGDLDALSAKLIYAQPGPDLKALRWTFGRFLFSDVSQLVINHAVDGSLLDFDFGTVSLQVATAYTGLVLRSSSGVAMSLADQDSSGPFATPRFLGSLATSWAFTKDHTVTFGAMAQQDLTSRSRLLDEWTTIFNPNKGGKVDTQYLTLKFDGPVVDRLFYEVSGTFETGTTLSWLADASSSTGFLYQNKPINAFLVETSVDYFLPQVLSSSLRARALLASGDSDAASAIEGNTSGDSNLFVAVTPTTLGTVFSPALSNLGYYEVGGSLQPVSGLPLVLSCKLMGFQRLVSGVINAPGVLRLGPVWMGQEADLSASWQVFSDLKLTSSFGAFLPTSGTFASSSAGANFQYAGNVGVKLSL